MQTDLSRLSSLAPVIVRAGEGRALDFGKEHAVPKLSPEQTGGQFLVGDYWVEPGGGPPLHVHTREDEVFFVTEGELEYRIGAETLRVGPGDIVFAPRNTPHAFRNRGSTNARFFVIVTGENFFSFIQLWIAELNQPAPDPANLLRIAADHGLEILETPSE